MSCNCNNGKCGLPKQPTYNNLHYGYIAPDNGCCCGDKDIKPYRKYILIDSKNIYPDDGIYIENGILYLTMIPDEYYYHVILDNINITQIVPIYNDRPNHVYNNTYSFLISVQNTNHEIKIMIEKGLIKLNCDGKESTNRNDDYYNISEPKTVYVEVDHTAKTFIVFDNDTYINETLDYLNNKVENIDNELINVKNQCNKDKIINYSSISFNIIQTQDALPTALLSNYVPAGTYKFDCVNVNSTSITTDPFGNVSIVVFELGKSVPTINVYGVQNSYVLNVYSKDDFIVLPKAAQVAIVGVDVNYLKYLIDNKITDNFATAPATFVQTISNIWLLPTTDVKTELGYTKGEQAVEAETGIESGIMYWETVGDFCTIIVKDLKIVGSNNLVYCLLPKVPYSDNETFVRIEENNKVTLLHISVKSTTNNSAINGNISGKGGLFIQCNESIISTSTNLEYIPECTISFTINYKYK